MVRKADEEKAIEAIISLLFTLASLAFILAWPLIKLTFKVAILLFKLPFRLIDSLMNHRIYLQKRKVTYSLDESPRGWVYVLSNPSIPGMIKIGMTTRKNCSTRVNELNRATGIPTKFRIEYKHPSPDPYQLEQRLHLFFKKKRVSDNREFFAVTPDEVKKAIIQLEPRQINPNVA